MRSSRLANRPCQLRFRTKAPLIKCFTSSISASPAPSVEQGANQGTQSIPPLPRSEELRKSFRKVYDFAEWREHRSRFRLVKRLFTTPQSNIIRNALPSILWVGFVSACLAAYQAAHGAAMLPAWLPSLSPSSACTAFVSQTTAVLSLLLVFRTNSSYSRWDEARKMWGGMLNRSRDLMRQAATAFPDDQKEAKEAVARWIIAFSRVMRLHFQPEATLEAELGGVLRPAELRMLLRSSHKPVKAIHALSQIIQNVPMNAFHHMQMSANLTHMHDALGGCERLLRAPIPISYTRHTARFLFVWLTLLPFALYSQCGGWVVIVCSAIAAVLCGIEEIGAQIEEPFGILPLDNICKRIENDVMATLNDDEDTKAVLEEAGIAGLEPPPRPLSPAAVAAASAAVAAAATAAAAAAAAAVAPRPHSHASTSPASSAALHTSAGHIQAAAGGVGSGAIHAVASSVGNGSSSIGSSSSFPATAAVLGGSFQLGRGLGRGSSHAFCNSDRCVGHCCSDATRIEGVRRRAHEASQDASKLAASGHVAGAAAGGANGHGAASHGAASRGAGSGSTAGAVASGHGSEAARACADGSDAPGARAPSKGLRNTPMSVRVTLR